MPTLDNVVNITILTAASQISREGFGTALILGGAAAAAKLTDLTRTFQEPSELLSAGFLTSDPEYLAAVALKGQTPAPVNFKIGKRSNLPTQSVKVTPVAPVRNTTDYKATFDGLEAKFTSDANATANEIATGLKTAIDALAPAAWVRNTAYVKGDKRSQSGRRYECITAGTSEDAVAGPAVKAGNDVRGQDIVDGTCHWKFVGMVPTVTDGGGYLTIVSPVAGEYIRMNPADFNLLRFQQNHADPGIAADLAAILLIDRSWYALVDCFPSLAETLAAAAWIESEKKLHVVASSDGGIPTSAVDDIATAIKAAAYARTAVGFHPVANQFFDAAWLGARLPLDPGSETWAYCRLAGITSVTMNPDQQNKATGTAESNYTDGKGCNIYVTIGGQAATWPGIVGALEFIDKVRGCDALKSDAQVNVYERMVSASSAGSKIPFTDAGIAVIKAALLKTLDKYVEIGFLSPATTYVNAPKAADVSSLDKQARTLTNVKAGGVIAGAIHQLKATITLTY